MSDLYSRDNLTTAEATPGLLHEVAASFLKDTTIESANIDDMMYEYSSLQKG